MRSRPTYKAYTAEEADNILATAPLMTEAQLMRQPAPRRLSVAFRWENSRRNQQHDRDRGAGRPSRWRGWSLADADPRRPT